MKLKFYGSYSGCASYSGSNPCFRVDTNVLCEVGDNSFVREVSENEITSINDIIISHTHQDHCAGLPDLLLMMHLLNKKNDVNIYVPSKGRKVIQNLLFNEMYSAIGNEVKPHIYNLKPCKTYKLKKHSLTAAQAEHYIPTLAYRLDDFSGKSVTYSSDTRPSENIVKLAKSSDILIHDCSFLEKGLASKYMHSTPKEAGLVANKAEVKKLILTQFAFGRRNQENLDEFKRIAETVFDGEVIIAYKGLEIKV
jgi:ribonuclease Z